MTQSKAPNKGVLLSKEERRALLEQLERSTRRSEMPEQILQRAEQALTAGQLGQARRLVQQAESTAPQLAGLAYLKERLQEVEKQAKQQTSLKATEEMLIRFIQERKKPLAQMALESLLEIAPDHPRHSEYRLWVADLDTEVALQKRLEAAIVAGRTALAAGDLEAAKSHLEALRKVDPQADSTETLAAEISAAERGYAQRADIGRLKQQLEGLLERGALAEAERAIDQLRQLDVPKITLDFLLQRLAQVRAQARSDAELESFDVKYRRYLEQHEWQAARDLAKTVGERFKQSSRAAEMFTEVNRLESEERRQQSVVQGIAALESYITKGQRREAELALKVLRSLDVDPTRLAHFQQRIATL